MPTINIPNPDATFIVNKPNIPDCWSPQPIIQDQNQSGQGGN